MPLVIVTSRCSRVAKQLAKARRGVVDQPLVPLGQRVRQFDPNAGQVLPRSAAVFSVGANRDTFAPVLRYWRNGGRLEQIVEENAGLLAFEIADVTDEVFVANGMNVSRS